MIGIPPPTLASKPRRTPRRSAARTISSPCTARSALFAVTTSLPAAIAARTKRRAGSYPPISSMTMSSAGSSSTDLASFVRRAGFAGMPRSVSRSRSAIATTSIGRPTRRAMSARCVRRSLRTPVPIVPKPISPTLTGPATRSFRASAGARRDVRPHGAPERLPDAANRLSRAVLVLDQREAHVRVAVLAEADARGHGDLRLAQQMLRELEGAHRLERVRDLRPDEHGRLRLRDVPADALEAVAEDVPALAVVVADLVHVGLRPVEGVRRGDLDGLEDAVVEVALDA